MEEYFLDENLALVEHLLMNTLLNEENELHFEDHHHNNISHHPHSPHLHHTQGHNHNQVHNHHNAGIITKKEEPHNLPLPITVTSQENHISEPNTHTQHTPHNPAENHHNHNYLMIEPKNIGRLGITIKTQIQTNRRTNFYLDAEWPTEILNQRLPIFYYPPVDPSVYDQLKNHTDPTKVWLAEMMHYFYGTSSYIEVQFWVKNQQMQLISKCNTHSSILKLPGQSYDEKTSSLEEAKWTRNTLIFGVNFNCTRTCFKSEIFVFVRVRCGHFYLESGFVELPFRRSEKRKNEQNITMDYMNPSKRQLLHSIPSFQYPPGLNQSPLGQQQQQPQVMQNNYLLHTNSNPSSISTYSNLNDSAHIQLQPQNPVPQSSSTQPQSPLFHQQQLQLQYHLQRFLPQISLNIPPTSTFPTTSVGNNTNTLINNNSGLGPGPGPGSGTANGSNGTQANQLVDFPLISQAQGRPAQNNANTATNTATQIVNNTNNTEQDNKNKVNYSSATAAAINRSLPKHNNNQQQQQQQIHSQLMNQIQQLSQNPHSYSHHTLPLTNDSHGSSTSTATTHHVPINITLPLSEINHHTANATAIANEIEVVASALGLQSQQPELEKQQLQQHQQHQTQHQPQLHSNKYHLPIHIQDNNSNNNNSNNNNQHNGHSNTDISVASLPMLYSVNSSSQPVSVSTSASTSTSTSSSISPSVSSSVSSSSSSIVKILEQSLQNQIQTPVQTLLKEVLSKKDVQSSLEKLKINNNTEIEMDKEKEKDSSKILEVSTEGSELVPTSSESSSTIDKL